MAELGRSPQREKRNSESGRTAMLLIAVQAYEGQMRRSRSRPRGGIHHAAVERVAQHAGLTYDALERRLKRHGQRARRGSLVLSMVSLLQELVTQAEWLLKEKNLPAIGDLAEQLNSSAASLGAAIARALEARR
jgi:hypothetical protein